MQLGFSSRKPLAACRGGLHFAQARRLAGCGPGRKIGRLQGARRCLRGAVAPWRAAGEVRLFAMKLALQFGFRPLQPVAFGSWQVLAGAVDIEDQHRQRRAIGAGFPAPAVFRRTFQRRGNLRCTGELEHPAIQIERVALFRDALRPAPRTGFSRFSS